MMDRIDEAAASILAAYTAKQIASGGHEVWPPELAAQMRVDDMRAAILASLPVLLGPVVAEWRTSAEVIRGFHRASWFDRGQAQGIERCADDLAALYAPSLGEGDGDQDE